MQGILLDLTLLASDIKLNGQGRHPLDFPMTPMLAQGGRQGGQTALTIATSPSVGKSFCRSFHTSQPHQREGERYRVPKRAISPWGNHLSLHQDMMMTPACSGLTWYLSAMVA